MKNIQQQLKEAVKLRSITLSESIAPTSTVRYVEELNDFFAGQMKDKQVDSATEEDWTDETDKYFQSGGSAKERFTSEFATLTSDEADHIIAYAKNLAADNNINLPPLPTSKINESNFPNRFTINTKQTIKDIGGIETTYSPGNYALTSKKGNTGMYKNTDTNELVGINTDVIAKLLKSTDINTLARELAPELANIIGSQLDPTNFYEYLKDYAGSRLSGLSGPNAENEYKFHEDELDIIEAAFLEIEQQGLSDNNLPNTSEIKASPLYKEYLKY